MTAAAGVVGALIGFGLWRVAFDLAPDLTGRAVVDLRPRNRRALGFLAVAGGGIGAALACELLPDRAATVAFVLVAAASPGLAAIDLVLHRLPYAIIGAVGAGVVAVYGIDAIAAGQAGPMLRSLWGLLAAGALALVYWRLAAAFAKKRATEDRAPIGLGDVAVFALIGLSLGWLGWADWWLGLFTGLLIVAATAITRWWRTGDQWATLVLGPQLLAGWWVAITLSTATTS